MMGAVTELVINFALPIPECWQLLSEYNSRAVPPFEDRELHEMIVWAEAQPGERRIKDHQSVPAGPAPLRRGFVMARHCGHRDTRTRVDHADHAHWRDRTDPFAHATHPDRG